MCGMAVCCEGRPNPEQAVCAPVQVQIAFCLQQGMHLWVDCVEAADRRLSGLDWLLLCAAAGQQASPLDRVNWRTPGGTKMRCHRSVTPLIATGRAGTSNFCGSCAETGWEKGYSGHWGHTHPPEPHSR